MERFQGTGSEIGRGVTENNRSRRTQLETAGVGFPAPKAEEKSLTRGWTQKDTDSEDREPRLLSSESVSFCASKSYVPEPYFFSGIGGVVGAFGVT